MTIVSWVLALAAVTKLLCGFLVGYYPPLFLLILVAAVASLVCLSGRGDKRNREECREIRQYLRKETMMKRIVFIMAVVLPVMHVYADSVFLGSYADSDGRHFRWYVDIDAAAETVSWNGVTPYPYDIPRLIAVAHDYARRKAVDAETVRIDAIHLQRIDRAGHIDALHDKWFFVISLKDSLPELPNAIRLLPDGRIIEPVSIQGDRDQADDVQLLRDDEGGTEK